MAYDDVLAALADPTRRKVFEELLEQPLSVREIADRQTVSRPAVSQHLKVLESAQLVTVKPMGNRRLYEIKRQGLQELREYLNRFWSDALSAYGAEITRRVNKQKGKKRSEH